VGSECVRFHLEPVADVVLSSGVDDGELECNCIGSVTVQDDDVLQRGHSNVNVGDSCVGSGTVVLSTGYVTGMKMKVWSAGWISYVETWLSGMSISIR